MPPKKRPADDDDGSNNSEGEEAAQHNAKRAKVAPSLKRGRADEAGGGGSSSNKRQCLRSAGADGKYRMTENEEIALAAGREIIFGDTVLDEWDMAKYEKSARLIIVLGKRNTGKTVWALNFVYAQRHIYPVGIIITKTAFNGFWRQFAPHHLVVSEFSPALIERISKMQEARVLQQGANSRFLILIDDMASDVVMRYSEVLTTMAYNGRHYNLDIVFLTQDVVKATTAMRRNADVFAMLTVTGQLSLDHVYKEFGSIDFADYKHFQQCMLKHTEDFGVFIIDNMDPNKRGKERFFHSKGLLPPNDPSDGPALPLFALFAPWAWGASDEQHKREIVEQQRKNLLLPKKYSEGYMHNLKNAQPTRVSTAQVQGTTRIHQQTASSTAQSLFAKLASMGGPQ